MIKIKDNFLDPFVFFNIKGNLTTKNTTIKPFGHHVDIPFKCKTAILYINNNNGITVFERGKKIESRENRMITFSSNLKHTGTTHTDEKVRIVLNINYLSATISISN